MRTECGASIAPSEVIHLCAGLPMYRPHTMGVYRNGRFCEVSGRWNGVEWVDFRFVKV